LRVCLQILTPLSFAGMVEEVDAKTTGETEKGGHSSVRCAN
jgi:hypothetical protein